MININTYGLSYCVIPAQRTFEIEYGINNNKPLSDNQKIIVLEIDYYISDEGTAGAYMYKRPNYTEFLDFKFTKDKIIFIDDITPSHKKKYIKIKPDKYYFFFAVRSNGEFLKQNYYSNKIIINHVSKEIKKLLSSL